MSKLHRITLLVALLVFVVFGVAIYYGNTRTTDDVTPPEEDSAILGDYPPMLRFDGIVYKTANLPDSVLYSIQGIDVGKIEHYEPGGEPTQDRSANNDLVGLRVVVDERMPGYVFVKKEETYLPYRSLKAEWSAIALTFYPDAQTFAAQKSPAHLLNLNYQSDVWELKDLVRRITTDAEATSKPMGFPRYLISWTDGTGEQFELFFGRDGIFTASFMDQGNHQTTDGADIYDALGKLFDLEP